MALFSIGDRHLFRPYCLTCKKPIEWVEQTNDTFGHGINVKVKCHKQTETRFYHSQGLSVWQSIPSDLSNFFAPNPRVIVDHDEGDEDANQR